MNKTFLSLFLSLLSVIAFQMAFGQASVDSTSQQEMRKAQLRIYEKQFKEYSASNKNSLALEVLQRFGQLNTAKLLEDKANMLNELNEKFIASSKERKTKLNQIRNETGSLETEIASLESANASMAARYLIFFIILIAAITLTLIWRKRVFSTLVSRLELSDRLKNQFIGLHEAGLQNEKKLAAQLRIVSDANEELLKNADFFNKIIEDKNHPENKSIRQLMTDLRQTGRIALTNGNTSDTEEPVKTNLNNLIEDISALVLVQNEQNDAAATPEISLDLEDILPEVEIYPDAFRKSVLCLYSNALESVRKKSSESPEGYQPKISITTRKLPRFVQVRIRNNGDYTFEPVNKRDFDFDDAGTGQQTQLNAEMAAKIITEQHNGELLYESGNGTHSDAIIRLQIHALH
ncbi:MAG TPA: hypothetical protein VFW78_11440 [Bacteroidia bacterium]|nr:hypothetical protein [Bacteroidia bacterium]